MRRRRRCQRSEIIDQIRQALAFVETGGGIGQTPLLISEPLISDLWKSRKEVIQPQVPLRLPCYDFTPVTNHSVDACLPCGLAQRLREQPASVM